MRPIFLFDLDETVIDSTHRQGETLSDWRRMNTPANVMRDSTLPLASTMIRAISEGLDVGILTSRVMGKVDRVWLHMRGMLPRTILSRDIEDLREPGAFKLAKVHHLAHLRGESFESIAKRVILWDDNKSVQNTLKAAGIRVINPVSYNQFKKGLER